MTMDKTDIKRGLKLHFDNKDWVVKNVSGNIVWLKERGQKGITTIGMPILLKKLSE